MIPKVEQFLRNTISAFSVPKTRLSDRQTKQINTSHLYGFVVKFFRFQGQRTIQWPLFGEATVRFMSQTT